MFFSCLEFGECRGGIAGEADEKVALFEEGRIGLIGGKGLVGRDADPFFEERRKLNRKPVGDLLHICPLV